jgi:hypothetical protein
MVAQSNHGFREGSPNNKMHSTQFDYLSDKAEMIKTALLNSASDCMRAPFLKDLHPLIGHDVSGSLRSGFTIDFDYRI